MNTQWLDPARRGWTWQGWIGLLARLVVGVVWIIAGAAKIRDPAESVRAVRAYELLPEVAVPAVGYGLPLLEIVIGILLVLGLLTRLSAIASALLFVVFIAGIASVWARGITIDCGCFGGGGFEENAAKEYPMEIARDIGLLLLSGWLIIRPRSVLAMDSVLFPPAPPLEIDEV